MSENNAPNPFAGKAVVLDDLLRFVRAKMGDTGVAMLRAWEIARDHAEQAKEQLQESPTEYADYCEGRAYDGLDNAQAELDAILDDGAHDFVVDEYADVLLALETICGREAD